MEVSEVRHELVLRAEDGLGLEAAGVLLVLVEDVIHPAHTPSLALSLSLSFSVKELLGCFAARCSLK